MGCTWTLQNPCSVQLKESGCIILWIWSWSCFRQGLWYQSTSVRGPISWSGSVTLSWENLIVHTVLQMSPDICLMRRPCKLLFFFFVSHISNLILTYFWNKLSLMKSLQKMIPWAVRNFHFSRDDLLWGIPYPCSSTSWAAFAVTNNKYEFLVTTFASAKKDTVTVLLFFFVLYFFSFFCLKLP